MKSFIGIGIRRKRKTQVLDVYFPKIITNQDVDFEQLKSISKTNDTIEKTQLGTVLETISDPQLKQVLRALFESKNNENSYSEKELFYIHQNADHKGINTVEEAYFKLQLISQRQVLPHELDLSGIFGQLPNICWTNYGPILVEDVEVERIKHFGSNTPLEISHVDKFPYLINYHVPSGVRVASGAQVRLGAYLGTGTTVMQAGFVNFNAGTRGNAMVEGRISGGVVVDKDSDVGGGASIMGTLSGGNQHVISVGKKCLLGANSGLGISLGDGCTVEAGLYITGGMKISLLNENNEPVNLDGEKVAPPNNQVKGRDLSGKGYMLYYRDSVSGKVIAKPNQKTIELNKALHQND